MLPSQLLACVATLARLGLAATLPERVAKASNEMTWKGPVFPGAESIELHGDAQSIYDQIIAINPNYAPEDSAEALGWIGDDASAGSGVSVLSTTANTISTLASRATCKAMGTGQFLSIREGYRRLAQLGGNCGTPARECRRMTCNSPNSATYICSEQDAFTDVACAKVAQIIEVDIVATSRGNCGCWDARIPFLISGNYYESYFSIWVGYGRCGVTAPNDRPTAYPFPGEQGWPDFCPR
ncbi:hypothetical protein MAPG_11848 [Magnaporthiopsis poae ATCC 64411]|uniref:Uncharacterized protein n=1 Tax=Magnaporthiopsis poae (strain ATCC 64411 / 73-15) TaxID=644358 RepID=A0A0C4EGB7_MAGP6|nr:hypothetical protein MAPG_11848 [Magnaporthiopsis poae ATCC 64411]